jgi:hypothetical protein
MRCPRTILTAGFVAALILLASTSFAQTKAFVIDERLSALRKRPDLKATLIRRLRIARPVFIIESRKSSLNHPPYFRVAVTRRTRGWIHQAALAVPGRAGDDLSILNLINSLEQGIDRISLCRIFLDNFSRSALTPRVMLALGREAETAAAELSRRAGRRLQSLNDFKPGHKLRDYYLSDPGLDRYNRLRVTFEFDHASRSYVYDGKAYREIIKRFPYSPEAALARERILSAERRLARRPNQ